MLLIFVPVTFWLEFTHASDALIFGSAIQVALLVVLSFVMGNSVARDGETNGLEGFMLLEVCLILGIVFFFLPSA